LAVNYFVLSQCTRLTDGFADGTDQTEFDKTVHAYAYAVAQ